MNWDSTAETPGGAKAAITGVVATAKPADAAADDEEWTVEELKKAKPLFLYYFVDGLTQGCEEAKDEPSFDFSRRLELGGFADKVVEEIQANWRAKKVGLELDADRKLEKNQARIEFWSFTKVKMGSISIKEQNLLNPGPLRAQLKKYALKNSEICAREIAGIEARRKAREEAEKRTAEKSTAKAAAK